MIIWTDEIKHKLTKAWIAGDPPLVIAQKLNAEGGHLFTYAAVAKQANRMGLPFRRLEQTRAMDSSITALHRTGMSFPSIAKTLGITLGSCQGRIRTMISCGLLPRRPRTGSISRTLANIPPLVGGEIEPFSMRLRRCRVAAGLTQKQLATAIACQPKTVWQWESGGKFPQGERIGALAAILKVRVDMLLNESDNHRRNRKSL